MKATSFRTVRNGLLCAIASLLLIGATPPREPGHEPPDIEILETSRWINMFTIDMLKHCAGDEGAPANAVMSPQSIFHGLAMSYIASGGETRKELAGVLHFPNDDAHLLLEISGLRPRLNIAHQKLESVMANAAWLDTTYVQFRKEYVEKVEKSFGASLHSVKFSESAQVCDAINKWISEKTHGRIPSTLEPGDIRDRSVPGFIDAPALVTVNAVYFKADWGSRFEKKSTREHDFHVEPAKTEKALMMHQKSLLLYSEDDHFQFLEIPYIDGSFSMYILLPKEVLSIKDLMALTTTGMVIQLRRKAFAHDVDVLFPKFEMRSHFGMRQTLSEMGVKAAFDNQRADFDKMIVKKLEAFRVYISEVYHDAWIDVHEDGTEAAAATTTVHFSFGCSAPRPATPPAQFHADHPFLFMIVHNQSRSILFAGWVSNTEGLAQKAGSAGK